MPGEPRDRRRRGLRLDGYDYARAGAYFVTICTSFRACIFGDVLGGAMELNPRGRIVREEWFRSASIRDEVALHEGEVVVMPNHLHGIVWLRDGARPPVASGGTGGTVMASGPSPRRARGPGRRSLGSFVAGFKSAVTRRIRRECATRDGRVWQRGYHEHVIRGEAAIARIRQYIANNPLRWDLDPENPDASDAPRGR